MEEFLRTADELADLGRSILRDGWWSVTTSTLKSDGSVLTSMDTLVEQRLRDHLRLRHPDHGILGEEFGADGIDRDYVWVLDSIDGTRQFAAGLLHFGILIALCRHGRPVLGLMDQPMAGMRFVGTKARTTLNGAPLRVRENVGLADAVVALANPNSFDETTVSGFDRLRTAGRMMVFDGGCLAYGALARGSVDLCVNGPDLEPYDICPLVPIVRGAGGVILGMDGTVPDLDYRGALLAASSHALLQEARGCFGQS